MRRAWRLLAALAVVSIAMVMPSASAQAAPTPSPTLGSTNSPGANPPGAADTDPQDYDGAIWVVVGVAIVAVLVVGGTLVLTRRRRQALGRRHPPH